MATPNATQQALLGDILAAKNAVAGALTQVQGLSASAKQKGAPAAQATADAAAAGLEAQLEALTTLYNDDSEIANLG